MHGETIKNPQSVFIPHSKTPKFNVM